MARERSTPWRWSPEEIAERSGRIRAGRDLTPTLWPDGKQVAVAATFDIDAETVWLDFNETGPSALSRGTFGARRGMPRILDMLEGLDLRATFFTPAATLTLHPELAKRLADSPHEVGYHGYCHESPRRLPPDEEREVFMRGIDSLEGSVGYRPVGYRSPAFELSDITPSLLSSEGFLYDSSLMADDRPYELLAPDLTSPLIELPVEWMLDDWAYFGVHWRASHVGLRHPEEVFGIFREEFACARADGTLFILTMHPQVIGQRHRFVHLERFLRELRDDPAVWFTSCREIADWVTTQGAS